MHPNQSNDSPDTGISTSSCFLEDVPRAPSMYLLLKMKIDMALSMKLMQKRPQLWNVRTATRPTVQRNQANQLGHNHLKHNQSKHISQLVGREKFQLPVAAAEFTLVVLPLCVSHEII